MTTQHTYAIALDPALGIQPAAVADAWNRAPATAAQGALRTTGLPAKGFDLATMGLEFVGGLAVGLLTNYLYDLIKGAFAERPQASPYEIQVVDQPDGTKVIVIVARNP